MLSIGYYMDYLTVSAVVVCILKQRHTLLPRGARVCLDDNRLSESIGVGDYKQVASSPMEVFGSIVEILGKVLLGHGRMKMTISQNHSLAVEIKEPGNS